MSAALDLRRPVIAPETFAPLPGPVRWKFFHVGNDQLNGIKPARHLWL